MNYDQVVLLAVVQGLTEFLPVSSSGHLVIFQNLMEFETPPVIFDIFLHFGTLISILIVFRKRLAKIVVGLSKKEKWATGIFTLTALGTLPAAILGFFLKDYLEILFGSVKLVGFSFLITGFMLILTKIFFANRKNFETMKQKDALFIGIFQAIAIIPGISRSGATISSGLLRGLKSQTAFYYSFYLAIPAILGALLITVMEARQETTFQFEYLNQSLLGLSVSAFVGIIALLILEKIIIKSKFWYFGIYCFIAGFLSLYIIPRFLL